MPCALCFAFQTEKVDNIQQEKQRRTMGKEMAATREQMEKEKRLRDFALMKKEKQAQKLERERLRAEIAKDKAERKARGGTLNSVLGKDGYNPSGMSAQISGELEAADRSEEGGEGASSSSAAPPAKSSGATNEGAVDQAIEAISRYKVNARCLRGSFVERFLHAVSRIASAKNRWAVMGARRSSCSAST